MTDFKKLILFVFSWFFFYIFSLKKSSIFSILVFPSFLLNVLVLFHSFIFFIFCNFSFFFLFVSSSSWWELALSSWSWGGPFLHPSRGEGWPFLPLGQRFGPSRVGVGPSFFGVGVALPSWGGGLALHVEVGPSFFGIGVGQLCVVILIILFFKNIRGCRRRRQGLALLGVEVDPFLSG